MRPSLLPGSIRVAGQGQTLHIMSLAQSQNNENIALHSDKGSCDACIGAAGSVSIPVRACCKAYMCHYSGICSHAASLACRCDHNIFL